MAKSAAQPDRKAGGKSGRPGPRKPLLARKPADTGRRQEEKRTVAQRLVEYLKNVRLELRKVIWPKRPEITASTIIVIATLIVLAAYVMALDETFAGIINLITTGGQALPR